MSKPPRLALASLTVAVSLVPIMIVATRTRLTYATPGPGHRLYRNTATFPPAVVAVVISGLITLVTIAWLIRNIVGAPRPLSWIVPLGALLVTKVMLFVVMSMDRPVF